MAFGESFTIGTDHQRHVGIPRVRVTKKLLKVHLSRSRHEEIVAAHDFIDSLPRIIHHHGKVVGRYSIVSTEYDIVDSPFDFANQQIDESVSLAGCAQAKGRWPALIFPGPTFSGREIAARARVSTFREIAVRCAQIGRAHV